MNNILFLSEPLDLQGWMFEAEQKWLYETSYRLPDHATIVEIGSWKGLSTSNLCRGCVNTNKKVYVVDTWEGTVEHRDTYYAEAKSKDICQIFQNNMKILGYSELVVPLKGESVKVANNFKNKIDFLFIDGSHDEVSVRRDIMSWLPHCKETAIIAGHDFAFWAPDVIKVISEEFSIYETRADSIWKSTAKYYNSYQHITKAVQESSPRKSNTDIKFTIIIMAYNFSKRLKVCLESLRLQSFSENRFEIIIANPQSPDNLHEVLTDLKNNYSELLLREVIFAPSIGMDKGRIYNELAWEARGDTLCFLDADAVLPPNALQCINDAVEKFPHNFHSCFRRDIPIELVLRFLSGEYSIKNHWNVLSSSAKEAEESCWSQFAGKIGFMQIVNRDIFLKVKYDEGFLTVAQTDIQFADRYIDYVNDSRADFRIPGLEIFHLDHIRSWEGVTEAQ